MNPNIHWNDDPINLWDTGQGEGRGQENESFKRYQMKSIDKESWVIPQVIHLKGTLMIKKDFLKYGFLLWGILLYLSFIFILDSYFK